MNLAARGVARARSLIVALALVASACTPALVATPSPVSETPTPSVAPTPPAPSATPVPAKLECPGSDKTPGRAPGRGTSEQAENWAGYVIYKYRTHFTCVVGSWTQPTISCPSTGTANVAIWVGIDGVKDPKAGVDSSATLQQIGTQASCDAGRRSAFAWYQVIPRDPFSVPITTVTIEPGDRIWAMVSYASGSFKLRVVDVTSGRSFSIDEALAEAPRLTAEWIVEAPQIGCPSRCRIAALPHFSKVIFTGAYASTGAQRGSISDDAWTHDALDIVRSGTERASVSRLTGGGTSFSVTWRHR